MEAATRAATRPMPMRAALVPRPMSTLLSARGAPSNSSSRTTTKSRWPPAAAAAAAPPPLPHPCRARRPLARPPSASSSTDPILVSAVSDRGTIASLVADRLAGPAGEAHVWATGASAQFVAVGALAEAQPLLRRLSPGSRLEAAARWAGGTDFEPDDQKRRLRKLEVWARAVPAEDEEGEGEEEGGAVKRRQGHPRLSADRTRERDELVAAIARQLGTAGAPARPAASAAPPSLAEMAAAALAPPPPPPPPAAAAAAKKKRGRPPKKAPAPEPEQQPEGQPTPAAAEPSSSSAPGVAEIEARGEQAVMRALKAVLFLQQQQQQQHNTGGAGEGATTADGGAAAPASSVALVLAPRVDMVADTAAERRGEPAREVPGIVLEVRAVGGGGSSSTR